jgi:hypothetical protein
MIKVPNIDFVHLDTATPSERQAADQEIVQWAAEVLAEVVKKPNGLSEKKLNRYLYVITKFSLFLPSAANSLDFNQYFLFIFCYSLFNAIYVDRQQGQVIKFSTEDVNAVLILIFKKYFTNNHKRVPNYFKLIRNLNDTKAFTEQFREQCQEEHKKLDYYAVIEYLNEKKLVELVPPIPSIKVHPKIVTTILYEFCHLIRQSSQKAEMEKEVAAGECSLQGKCFEPAVRRL